MYSFFSDGWVCFFFGGGGGGVKYMFVCITKQAVVFHRFFVVKTRGFVGV